MNFEKLFDRGVIEPLGYRPKSSSIKPVHIANGLARHAMDRSFESPLLNRTVNPKTRPKRDPDLTTTARLLADAGERFGGFAQASQHANLELLRELLRAVLHADEGVYFGSEFCSYSLTNERLVTSDHNDHGTGRFLHALLATDLGTGPSPILAQLRAYLADATDEISLLTLPLIEEEDGSALRHGATGTPSCLSVVGGRGRARTFEAATARNLRAGFDTLARFVASDGGKLENLRRIVTFAAFALYQHVIHRAADLPDEDGTAPRRPPLVLDAIQEGRTPIGSASNATYSLAAKSVDRYIAYGLRSALLEIRSGRWSTAHVEDVVADLELKGTERDRARKRSHLRDTFVSYQAGGMRILDAFVAALVDLAHEELTSTPFDFARAVGVRCGLLAPRGNRAVRKRYAPSAELVEVLLAATIEPGQEVALDDLATRWWERFSIIVGSREADARDLSTFSIHDAPKEALRANAEALRELLISIGYARRYADGVTIIRLDSGGGR